jgi:hypothetical protein
MYRPTSSSFNGLADWSDRTRRETRHVALQVSSETTDAVRRLRGE